MVGIVVEATTGVVPGVITLEVEGTSTVFESTFRQG